GKGGLAGGFRSENLEDASLRYPSHSQGEIQPERACGEDAGFHPGAVIAQAHDASLPELLLDLGDDHLQRLFPILGLVLFHLAPFSLSEMVVRKAAARLSSSRSP